MSESGEERTPEMTGLDEYRRKLAAGEVKRVRRAPTVRALMGVIREKCVECMGGRDEPGYRGEIANCTAPTCPLYPHRPYQ